MQAHFAATIRTTVREFRWVNLATLVVVLAAGGLAAVILFKLIAGLLG